MAWRSCVAVVSGAMALGLAVYRRPRRALAAGGLSLALLAACGLSAYATWNPESVMEPKYSGLLTSAPQVVGDAKSIASRVGVYRAQLAQLIANVSRLYDVTSTLPSYEPDPSTIRVLHVADIHLNPAAWDVIRCHPVQVRVVIDSGDTPTTAPPREEAPRRDQKIRAPYVFIRGNHDSAATEASVRKPRTPSSSTTRGGRRWRACASSRRRPELTPDQSSTDGDAPDAGQGLRAAAQMVAWPAPRAATDVALVHDPAVGQPFDGNRPAGADRAPAQTLDPRAGRAPACSSRAPPAARGYGPWRARTPPGPCTVLYFDRGSQRLQGWDDIRLGGLGLTSAQIER